MRFVIALAISMLCASLSAAATRQLASPQRNKTPDNLRLLHGEHYRIHTDLDRALAEDLAKRMDAMYEEYSRRLASTFDVDHAGDKADVYLFAKRQSYLDFTNNKMSNAGGIAMPESRTVVEVWLRTLARVETPSTATAGRRFLMITALDGSR